MSYSTVIYGSFYHSLILTFVSSSFNLSETLAVISEKICAEVNSCLSQHGFTPFTPEKVIVLKGQIQALANPDNAVCKLIGMGYR